jgi:excisionase family DNA binding protein
MLIETVAAEIASKVQEQVRASTPVHGEPWRLLDVDEVATMLGRSRRTIHSFVRDRGLPTIRLDGGALAFDPDDVKQWAKARRVPE